MSKDVRELKKAAILKWFELYPEFDFITSDIWKGVHNLIGKQSTMTEYLNELLQEGRIVRTRLMNGRSIAWQVPDWLDVGNRRVSRDLMAVWCIKQGLPDVRGKDVIKLG